MGEELERRHHFVVGVFVVDGDVMYLLEGVQDEETESLICGADAVSVVNTGAPKRLEFTLIPRFGLSRDRWVVFVEGGIVLVKRGRYPWFVLVGRVRKYEAGDFYSFRYGEADRETFFKEYCPYSSEVVVLWLAKDFGGGLDGGSEFGSNV